MSILRTFNLRPLLRPAAPALTRGIRNYDVNTPTEGAVPSAIQGDKQPSLDAENAAQESETGEVDAERRAFVEASKKYTESDSTGAGELNEETVDAAVNQDRGKGNPDSF